MSAERAAHVGMDADGLVTEWDAAAGMLFGYSAEQAIGQPVADLIVPPELRPAHWRGLRRVASGGPSALAGRTVEVPALDAYGRRFLVELTIDQRGGDGGPPTRFVGMVSPVGAHSATPRPDSADA